MILLQYAVPYAPYLIPVDYVIQSIIQSIRHFVNTVQPRTALELRHTITAGIKAYELASLTASFRRIVQNDIRDGASLYPFFPIDASVDPSRADRANVDRFQNTLVSKDCDYRTVP